MDTVFIKNLPSLDLHGFDRESARVAIIDFINDNIKLKNKEFVIVHGIGTGVLKATTHEVLRKNKHVLEYKICYNNTGSTIVRINVK